MALLRSSAQMCDKFLTIQGPSSLLISASVLTCWRQSPRLPSAGWSGLLQTEDRRPTDGTSSRLQLTGRWRGGSLQVPQVPWDRPSQVPHLMGPEKLLEGGI